MRLLFFLALLLSQTAYAQSMLVKGQSEGPDYFPADLMLQEGVRGVTAYETRIDDPLDMAGQGNRIRLARIMTYDSYFNTDGQRTRTIHYQEGTNEMRDHLTYTYTKSGLPKKTIYVYPQPSNVAVPVAEDDPGRTAIVHRRETVNYYRENEKLDFRLVTNVNATEKVLTDSFAFDYDITGRLQYETRYVMGTETDNSVVRQFKHGQRTLTIYTLSNDELLSREINRKDLKGRLTVKEYYLGKAQTPNYREEYNYDPRGRLATISYAYAYDWSDHESVVSRKNVYDDRGKLVEAQVDYRNGKRVVRFYDYTYHSEAE